MAEELRFSLFAEDHASESFLKVGKLAASSADDVKKLFRSLSDIDRKSATARVALAGDKDAQAKLDKIDAKLITVGRRSARPDLNIEGAAKATAELSAIDAELDKVGAKAAGTEAAVGSGGLSGPGGMGALIGAGALLSPQLTAFGFGLGGLGLAAAGVAKPIAAAAQKAGGLEKNLKDLDPAQQQVARGLIGLGHEFTDFSQILEPQVVGVFAHGLSLAGNVLHDIEPVASAAGKALGSVLGQVDAEFQSGNWQSFFGFLAQQVGPDLHLVGNLLVSVLDALPTLLRDLEPLGREILADANATVKLVSGVGNLVHGLDQLSAGTDKAGKKQSLLATAFHNAAQNSYPELNIFGKVRDWLFGTADAADKTAKSTPAAAKGIQAVANQAFTAGTAVGALNTDLEKLSGLLSDQSAQIQWKQAQQAVTKAIRDTSGALDGNSKTALANRQLVIQSTQAALQYADQERKTGGSVEGAARTLQDQIHFLISTHDKSAWLRAELRLLENALHDLRSKHLSISVDAAGNWYVKGAGVGHGIPPGGSAPGAALGMKVSGGVAGRDSVLVRAMPGEVIVPTRMVNAGAVDHLRGSIPGFAAGGVVGHYGGPLPGLGPWLKGEDQATINALASATAAAFKAAKPPVTIGGFPGGGSSGASAAAAQAYALRTLPAYGWSIAQMLPLIALWNRESGWRWNATNPTSGAYGIPQSLPASKMAAAGPDWRTNPATQIRWGLGYIKGRYGSPAGAWAHELSAGWYDKGGYLPPGVSLAVNNTGRPEPVIPAGRTGGNTYKITVVVPPTVHKREVGREVVEAIREFEKTSGSSWRR